MAYSEPTALASFYSGLKSPFPNIPIKGEDYVFGNADFSRVKIDNKEKNAKLSEF